MTAPSGDPTPWIIAALTSLVGGGGLWGWLTERARAKARAPAAEADAQAAIGRAQAAFAEALTKQGTAFAESLMEERQAREELIAQLQVRVRGLEAENEQCRGENRQMSQRFDSLVSELRKRGIDLPARDFPGAFVMLEDGKATVLRPAGPETTDKGGGA
jgi:hypothetical protein